MSRPFLKWAGSKQKLVSTLLPLVPKTYGRYFEPFLGSASLFFSLRPGRAVLSDANSDLIATYHAVRDHVADVVAAIGTLGTDRESYYAVRKNRSRDPIQRAAEFIYLNKLCWNGLYRVNLKGEFNVPYGANKSGIVVEPDVLMSCSAALNQEHVLLSCADFSTTLESATYGDFVFLDPPYVTSHNNNGFIEYNENIFSWDDQVRLAQLACSLTKRGVTVLVTNANHQAVRALYDGFAIVEFERMSTLASSTAARRLVSEVAIIGRP